MIQTVQSICHDKLFLPFHLGSYNELELVELNRNHFALSIQDDQLQAFEREYKQGMFAYLVDNFEDQLSQGNDGYDIGRFLCQVLILNISPFELTKQQKIESYQKSAEKATKLRHLMPYHETIGKTANISPIYTLGNARYSGASVRLNIPYDVVC